MNQDFVLNFKVRGDSAQAETSLGRLQSALVQVDRALGQVRAAGRAVTVDAQAAPVLAAQRASVTEAIKAERDRRRVAGCPVGAYVFHSDDTSRIQQIGLVMLGANIPAGLQWKTVGGAMAPMTPTLAQQIFAAQAARDTALFATAESHIAAVNASGDPLAYDYSGGWPA